MDHGGTLRLTFDFGCGSTWHPVSLSLAVWGGVEATTPCDWLPETARRLVESDCRQRLDFLCQRLLHKLQQGFYEDKRLDIAQDIFLRAPAAQIEAFVKRVRESLEETAEAILRDGADNQEITSGRMQQALKSADARLCWAAAIMAGVRQNHLAVPRLVQLARKSDLGVQIAAVWALTKIGDARAMPVLQKWLIDKRLAGNARREIAIVLGRSGYNRIRQLIRALDFEELHQPVADIFGQIGPSALEPLIKTLRNASRLSRDGYYHLADGTVHALARIGECAVEPLIETLKHKDWYVRTHAAEALGEIGDRRAVGPLIEALHDKAEEVRSSAAWALGQIGDSCAVEPLIEFLTREKDSRHWEARTNAVLALGKIGDPRAIKPLRKVAQSKDPGERLKAREVLWTKFNEAVWPKRKQSRYVKTT